MISTRRGGDPRTWSTSNGGTWLPKPTAAILRERNQPSDWIECFDTK